ncbi:MAG: CPBP family intramembrane metalloprotease [Proteobacteria bacterium]|nr:CPBP family intramembrane metalloprotease [Pseudomonadota bacterium]MBS0573339.1 CPBP family intramembrane metalloprotease [Pseudomonadota bacterium]
MTFSPPSYRPHIAFSAPARARSELWRTLLGAGMILSVYLAMMAGFGALLRLHFGPLLARTILTAMFRGETPGMALLLLASFLGVLAGTFATVRLLHRRRAGTLFGPPGRVARDFRATALAVLAFNCLFLPFALADGSLRPGQAPAAFLVHLPLALVCLAIQTGAEELTFRAYFQQQLAARFASPLVWMLAPALLFTAGHYAPDTYGASAAYVLIWVLLFGLFTADLTARTGSIGASWGFHFANNAAAFLLIGSGRSMSGLALWVQPDGLGTSPAPLAAILVQCATLTCAWLAARIALRR